MDSEKYFKEYPLYLSGALVGLCEDPRDAAHKAHGQVLDVDRHAAHLRRELLSCGRSQVLSQ